MSDPRRWNACENAGCEGFMKTVSVTCGYDAGRTENCDECGRSVEHGWGGTRVRWEGRARALPAEED